MGYTEETILLKLKVIQENVQLLDQFRSKLNTLNNAIKMAKAEKIQITGSPSEGKDFIKKQIADTKAKMTAEKLDMNLVQRGVNLDVARSKNAMGFGNVMSMNLPTWQQWNKEGTKSVTSGGKLANTFRNLTHGMRGFRMEMLGIMFFGMGVKNTLDSLLQPALEASGLFELIAVTLEVFFLPAALSLMTALQPILDWFMNMDPNWQAAIGGIVMLTSVIAGIVMIIGTFALGLGSLIQVFGPLFGIAVPMGEAGFLGLAGTGTALSGIISGITGVFTSLISLISGPLIVVLALLGMAWLGNSQGITNALNILWSVFQDIFGRIMKIIGYFVDFFSALVSGDTTKAFDALKNIAKETVGLIIDAFIRLPLAILNVLKDIFWGIGNFVVTVGTTLFNLGGMIVDKLVQGIMGVGASLANALWSLIPEPFRGWLKTGATIAFNVGSVLSKGIANTFGFGTFASGGLVTRPTIGLLGENGPEMVTPLGQGGFNSTSFSPVYNISATISNGMDVRALADQLNSMLTQDYRRLNYR